MRIIWKLGRTCPGKVIITRGSPTVSTLQRKVGDTEQSLRRKSDRETKEPKGPPWVRFGAPLSTLTRLADGLGLKELALPASWAGFAPHWDFGSPALPYGRFSGCVCLLDKAQHE